MSQDKSEPADAAHTRKRIPPWKKLLFAVVAVLVFFIGPAPAGAKAELRSRLDLYEAEKPYVLPSKE